MAQLFFFVLYIFFSCLASFTDMGQPFQIAVTADFPLCIVFTYWHRETVENVPTQPVLGSKVMLPEPKLVMLRSMWTPDYHKYMSCDVYKSFQPKLTWPWPSRFWIFFPLNMLKGSKKKYHKRSFNRFWKKICSQYHPK